MTDFADPSTATGIDFKELLGSLLLISPLQVHEKFKTVHGEQDAVGANVVVLDGDKKGITYDNTIIFPKVLVGQLRANVGQKVLGRLGQGVAKPGQSPPWTLAPASEDDKGIARKYIAYIATQSIVAPSASTDPF